MNGHRVILVLGMFVACADAQIKLPGGVLRYDNRETTMPSLWQYIHKEWGWLVSSRPFGRSIAFLIGVSNYQYIEPKLRYVADDLKEMREFLLGTAGFDTVYVLHDADDVNVVEDYMSNEFPRTLRSDDRLLFYFSGHGTDRANIGYMQFAKARPDRYDANQYLDVTRCERWSPLIPAKHVLFLIDACNSGLGFDAKPGDSPRVDEDLLRLFSGDGSRAVMTAGIGKEKSFQVQESNKGGYSVFTRAFLDSVRNTDSASGFLILDEIMAGLRRNVAAFSRGSPARQMTPRLWQIPRDNRDKGTFIFLNPKAKTPPVPLPLKQYVKVTLKDGDDKSAHPTSTQRVIAESALETDVAQVDARLPLLDGIWAGELVSRDHEVRDVKRRDGWSFHDVEVREFKHGCTLIIRVGITQQRMGTGILECTDGSPARKYSTGWQMEETRKASARMLTPPRIPLRQYQLKKFGHRLVLEGTSEKIIKDKSGVAVPRDSEELSLASGQVCLTPIERFGRKTYDYVLWQETTNDKEWCFRRQQR